MPYDSIDQLPDPVKNTLTDEEQRQWLEVFNSVYAQAMEKNEKDPDIHAAKAAWSVVKKGEGVIVEAEDGEHWITTDTGAHILIGAEPAGGADPKREKLLAYKKQKSAEYRAKAKQVVVGKEEPMHLVGGHYEATYKGTKFQFADDVENKDVIYAAHKVEIDNMGPAQKAGFSNVVITNESSTWKTDHSEGQTGAQYDSAKKEIKIFSSNERLMTPQGSAHWNLSHESGHGVWDESETVAYRGNNEVDVARESFRSATKEEGRITDYADAWYKDNKWRGESENFAESTKKFTESDSQHVKWFAKTYPKTHSTWENLMALMDKEAEKP